MNVAAVLAVLGVMAPLYVLVRLQLGMVAGWTVFVEKLAQHLERDDRAAAQALCETAAGSVMAPLAQLGLRLLPEAPQERQEAERFFALGLAAAMVGQLQRITRLGWLALLGALPAAAMGLGLRFAAGWERYAAFFALLLGIFASLRAYLLKGRVVPRLVAALVSVLAKHATSESEESTEIESG